MLTDTTVLPRAVGPVATQVVVVRHVIQIGQSHNINPVDFYM